MGISKQLRLATTVVAIAAFMTTAWAGETQAAIISTGDVVPASDPSTWTNGTSGTTAYIGNTGYGALAVDGGSSMTTFTSYIGNNAGSSGSVTVTGSGSTWGGTAPSITVMAEPAQ